MTHEPRHTRDDHELAELIAGAPVEERDELAAIAQRLSARPIPRPGLRATIHARVAAAKLKPRPHNLRSLAAAYLCSGALFLALAVAGVSGVGPFAG